MVFWLSLNCQNYLSYCSKNGHKWTFFPKISFLANVLPTKINQNTTKSLKNLGTILLTQARYCSLAMMKKQKTYVNWDSAAILQLFLSYVWTILQPCCSYFAAILQLFCSYFADIPYGSPQYSLRRGLGVFRVPYSMYAGLQGIDWDMGHCVLCDNVVMQGACVYIYIYST